ncbi:hypothetical protein ACFFKC_14775 [Pseudoduganella danionis]|uniref:DUF3077 domain-containing protein n=1 Tax=Pseudoduganella danionis TaxID=1890295 RepID=A0ABW9SNF9_9BURK|nr:hypothetical protein [Pseudoduganella danionis]MTW33156.1 hypothetical protein [Pseudoduganella danionis]
MEVVTPSHTHLNSEPTPIVLDAPYGAMHVNRIDDIDHASMRAEQLCELLTLMSANDKQRTMLRLAKQLASEMLDKAKAALATDIGEDLRAAAKFADEVMSFLLDISQEELSNMLWLAQQICDELSGTLHGMADERGVA